MAAALGAAVTETDDPRDNAAYDLIVVDAEQKHVREVIRHAHTPVLTVTERVVAAGKA